MTDLRKLARGKDCMVRLPGICNGNPETTVLAHLRMAGVTGMGIKAPDVLGAWCCSSCHDAVDRRSEKDLEREYLRLAFCEGIMRTQAKLVAEGVLNW